MKLLPFKDLKVGDKFKIPGQAHDNTEWEKIELKQYSPLVDGLYNAVTEDGTRFIRIYPMRKVWVPPYEGKAYFHAGRFAYMQATKIAQEKGWKNLPEVIRAIADGRIEIPSYQQHN